MYTNIILKTTNERIKQLRKINGFTQKYVAEFLNISVSTYSKMEHGAKIPAQKILKLATLYNVDPAAIAFPNAKNEPDIIILSPEERKTISKLRGLSPEEYKFFPKFLSLFE